MLRTQWHGRPGPFLQRVTHLLKKIAGQWAAEKAGEARETGQLILSAGQSKVTQSRLTLTPRTVALEEPLSMGFFRQEYWNGLPFTLPGDLPDPGIKPAFLGSALAGRFFTTAPITIKHKSLGMKHCSFWIILHFSGEKWF